MRLKKEALALQKIIKKSLLKGKICKEEKVDFYSRIATMYMKMYMEFQHIHTFYSLTHNRSYFPILSEFKFNPDNEQKSVPLIFSFQKQSDFSESHWIINNKKINEFLTYTRDFTFNDKLSKKHLNTLLNNIVYLFVEHAKYKKINSYKQVTEEKENNFTNILEIRKDMQKNIQLFMPRFTNTFVVYLNVLLDI